MTAMTHDSRKRQAASRLRRRAEERHFSQPAGRIETAQLSATSRLSHEALRDNHRLMLEIGFRRA